MSAGPKPRNDKLRRARLKIPSPNRPGHPMSCAEHATEANRLLHEQKILNQDVDATYLAKLEAGEYHWVRNPHRRWAIRTAVGVETDADIGFYQHRSSKKDLHPATPVVEDLPELTSLGLTAEVVCSPEAGEPHDQGRPQIFDLSMQRRTVLRALGAVAASPLPLVQWEALRHGMVTSLRPDANYWEEVVADYGVAYYQKPADQVMESLQADLMVLHMVIPATEEPNRAQLLRAASHLSVVVALNLVAAGKTFAADRWWRDAKRYADDSRDVDTIVLARAWDVVNSCYYGRSPSRMLTTGEEVLPLAERRISAASCGLLAGHAQALSLTGRHTEAVETVRKLAAMAEALPSAIVADEESLWAWPEHRLRHTEAWVYAHAGKLSEARRAQERAVQLYPATMPRLRAQVQLHHAAAEIRSGHIPDGLRLAADVLDELPAAQHNELLRAVARQVVGAVPERERQRTAYRELTDRVTLPRPPA